MALIFTLLLSSLGFAGPVSNPRGMTNFNGHDLFIPKEVSSQQALVVVLHGCLQNSKDMAGMTGWNQWAEKRGFFVLYPNQKKGAHALNCWNWYKPEHQMKDQGEPKVIMELVRRVKAQYKTEKLYIAGMSSGAGMAATLAACYPKQVDGILLHSGPAYASARNDQEALDVLRNGPSSKTDWNSRPCSPNSFTGKVMVVQGVLGPRGKKDRVVHPAHLDRHVVDFYSGLHLSKKEKLSSPKGMSYDESFFIENGKLKGIIFLVYDLEHAWSGGAADFKFSDPNGPDATRRAFELFMN